MVGRAIATAAALLDVTTVYFSGVLVDVFGDPLVESMRRELAARSRLPALSALRTVESLGSASSLVAAAALTRVPSRI